MPPAGDGWAFEIKWDGVRAPAFIADGGVRISRPSRRPTRHARYPELAAIGAALVGHEAILDGEIVAFDEAGRRAFSSCSGGWDSPTEATIRLRSAETPVTYVVFDLLWLDGRSLLAEPYDAAARAARRARASTGPIGSRLRHHVGDGARLLEASGAQGLEGIVAKRLGSPYRPGQRSREWIKVHNRRGQELVIGGWMPGEGTRGRRVGSLLVGHWDATPEEAERLGRPQRLVYAGGVGTGFTQAMLAELHRAAGAASPSRPPRSSSARTRLKYAQRARDRGAGPVWVEPKLVCQVAFSRVDARGHRAPVVVQGPARRQGPARGRPRGLRGRDRRSRSGARCAFRSPPP